MILTISASHGGSLAPVDFGHGDPVVVKAKTAKFSGFVFSTGQLSWDICVDTSKFKFNNLTNELHLNC